MFLNNYHNYSVKLYISITASKIFCIIDLCVIYFAYAAGKLCTIFQYYFSISVVLAAAFAPTPTTVVVPVTIIYASL